MALTDRIRRQLLDGVTFIPKAVPESAADHLFVDPNLQLRLGHGSDIGHIPMVVNPITGSIPSYDSKNKVWVPLAVTQALVSTGTFLSGDWVVEGGVASIVFPHDLGTDQISITVFDLTTSIPTETYVDVQVSSTATIKLLVAPGAVFTGSYIIQVIAASGAVVGGGSGGGTAGAGGILNYGAMTGTVVLDWGTNRVVKATLTGATTLSFDVLASLVADRTTLILSQDGQGGRLLTWGSGIKWSNGFQPDGTLTAGAADLYEFVWDGTYYTCVNLIQNIS